MMRPMRTWILLVAVLAACGDDDGPSSQNDGELGGHCYPNGTCNIGLTCSAGLCSVVDASVSGDGQQGGCADDSALEPNEAYTSAWVTPVDTTKTLNLASLAICPAGDKDVYAITLNTANENLEIIVVYETSTPALQASILNSSGIALANATMTAAKTIRAYTPNMPTGTYYANVQGPGTGQNNYSLTINVTGP